MRYGASGLTTVSLGHARESMKELQAKKAAKVERGLGESMKGWKCKSPYSYEHRRSSHLILPQS